MMAKDPEQRIPLLEIMDHDWITCNGVQPMPRHFYPSINVRPEDTQEAIKKVEIVEIIKIRIRQRLSQGIRKLTESAFGNANNC